MEATSKPVPGFPGYTASTDGVVFGQQGQPLKPDSNKAGYLRVRPIVDGRMRTLLVHRAVALAHIGEPPDDERIFVGHRDGNPANNRVENLRWVTYEENWEDRRGHGNNGRGEQNGRSKFTQTLADELRAMYATGRHSYQKLADHFGISQAQANKIGRGLYWPPA